MAIKNNNYIPEIMKTSRMNEPIINAHGQMIMYGSCHEFPEQVKKENDAMKALGFIVNNKDDCYILKIKGENGKIIDAAAMRVERGKKTRSVESFAKLYDGKRLNNESDIRMQVEIVSLTDEKGKESTAVVCTNYKDLKTVLDHGKQIKHQQWQDACALATEKREQRLIAAANQQRKKACKKTLVHL